MPDLRSAFHSATLSTESNADLISIFRANHRFKFRAIGASSSGLRNSFATRTVGDWNQLPPVVVEQVSPAAFKNQLVACRMP